MLFVTRKTRKGASVRSNVPQENKMDVTFYRLIWFKLKSSFSASVELQFRKYSSQNGKHRGTVSLINAISLRGRLGLLTYILSTSLQNPLTDFKSIVDANAHKSLKLQVTVLV